MNTHGKQTQRDTRTSVSGAVISNRSYGNSAFQFADNRTDTGIQTTHQKLASQCRRVKQAHQLKFIASSRSAGSNPPIQLVSSGGGVIQRVVNGVDLKIRVTPELTGVVEGGDHDGEIVQLGRMRNRSQIGDILTATVVDGKVTDAVNESHQERQRQDQIAANFRLQVQNWLVNNSNVAPIELKGGRVFAHTRSRGNALVGEIRSLLRFGEVTHIETRAPTVFEFTMAIPRNRVNQYVSRPDYGEWTIVGELSFTHQDQRLKVWHHGPGG